MYLKSQQDSSANHLSCPALLFHPIIMQFYLLAYLEVKCCLSLTITIKDKQVYFVILGSERLRRLKFSLNIKKLKVVLMFFISDIQIYIINQRKDLSNKKKENGDGTQVRRETLIIVAICFLWNFPRQSQSFFSKSERCKGNGIGEFQFLIQFHSNATQ